MDLKDTAAKISEIALDPFNPRDSSFKNMSQQQILDKTINRKETKELLRSMNDGVRWVNKIVVISFDDFKAIHKDEKYDVKDVKYVAIEGNTRLSCLKSGKLSQFGPDAVIPIIIAQKSANDTISTFVESILITQGIANVMVVKEWSVVSKAKHIYDMYSLKIKNSSKNKKEALKDSIRSIAEELGISQVQVRDAVKRYTIYSKLSEDVEAIPEEKWGYLEAFDTNQDTRNFIGLSEEYEWDEEKAEEILEIIPDLIANTVAKGISTKTFRDQFKQFVNENEDNDRTDVLDMLREVKGDVLLSDKLSTDIQKDGQADWEKKLDSIFKQIKQYPIAESWAKKQVKSLEDILGHLTKIIDMIKKF